MKRDLDFTAPATHLRLPDGRLVAWRAYGLPGAPPLYFSHGFPGSERQAALVHAQAAAVGVELVAFSRPGFGSSSPDPRASIDNIAADVSDLADHLGHRRFGVIGVSCGGPYALACARLLPRRVAAVGLLAGMAPMDRPELRRGQLPLLRAMFALARLHRSATAPLLALDAWLFRRDPERALRVLASALTAPDRALLDADAGLRAAFGASLADAYRQGAAGAMAEARRIATWRSEALRGIAQPVHVCQSGHDRHVPPAMGRRLAQVLPRATLHECPQDGHLSVAVHRFADCARRLAAAL
jgi:pimeloyl-ACP methyl ester carboxylesterase